MLGYVRNVGATGSNPVTATGEMLGIKGFLSRRSATDLTGWGIVAPESPHGGCA
jgi:hypothetical protein